LIHSKPVLSDLPVQILIANCGAFQLRSQSLGAPMADKVLDRLVDETATLPSLSQPVNGLDGSLWQDNVDAFAHGNES